MTLKTHIWYHSEVGWVWGWLSRLSAFELVRNLQVYFLLPTVSPSKGRSITISYRGLFPSSPPHKDSQPLGDKCEVPVQPGLGKCLGKREPHSRRCSSKNRTKYGVVSWKCERQGKYRTESCSGGEMRVKCWSACPGLTATEEVGGKGMGAASSNLRYFIF